MTSLRPSVAPRVAALAAAAAFTYLVLVGGTSVGETDPALRLVNALLGAGAIVLYVRRLPAHADRFDVLILSSLLAFVGAALLSTMPRQSLDAAIAALALAAATYVARTLGADPTSRWAVLAAMRALFLLLVVITLLRWVPLLVDWWILSGRAALPPLDLSFPGQPWGHRHDLTLLIVLLYPSWWVPGPRSSMAKVAALGLGVPAAAVVLLDGSRTVWLALGLATMVVIAPSLLKGVRGHRYAIPAVVGLGAVVAIGIVTTALAPVIERTLDFATLGARGAMWTAATEVWLDSPLAGAGPGTFVWDLQRTAYFDTSSWAPRHPDSVLFQLLPEAGVLGLIAVGLVIVAAVPALLRPGSIGPRWALLAFAFAGIGNSPTDFTFLLVVAIAWIGIAVPRGQTIQTTLKPSTWRRGASMVLLVVLGVASAASAAGSFAYESARAAVAAGNLVEAERHLSTAIALDPGHALYARQRGIARYLSGDVQRAATDLERATEANPSDDLAWRSLALARRAAQDAEGAEHALRQALRSQRSDLTNLLLAASWSGADGDRLGDREQLAEAVLAVPGLIAAPAWSAYVAAIGEDFDVIIESAIDRWVSGGPAPMPVRNQPLELVGFASRDDLRERAVEESRLPRDLADAAVATFACAPDSQSALRQLESSRRRLSEYWRLVAAASARAGDLDRTAVEIMAIMNGRQLDSPADALLNPLDENSSGGFSADAWGYERNPIEWPASGFELPSPSSGRQRWVQGDGDPSTRALLCNGPS